jgi:hypothetical protein
VLLALDLQGECMLVGGCHVLTDIWPSMVQSRNDIDDEKSSAFAAPRTQEGAYTAPPSMQLLATVQELHTTILKVLSPNFVVAARLRRVAECLELFELPAVESTHR